MESDTKVDNMEYLPKVNVPTVTVGRYMLLPCIAYFNIYNINNIIIQYNILY